MNANQMSETTSSEPRMKVAHLSSVEDMALYLRVPVVELQRAIDKGHLRVVPPRDEIRIHEADLEEFLATHPLDRRPRRSRNPFKKSDKKLLT